VRAGMARRRGRAGIELESAGFYRQILVYPLRHSEHGRALRNEALVLLSQVATMAGGLRELLFPSRRRSPPSTSGEHRARHAPSAIL